MEDAKKNIEKAQAKDASLAERTKDRVIFTPAVDITEDSNNLYIYADVPGATEKGVNITLENDVLTIEAQVEEAPMEGYTRTYSEYATGDYYRAFTLNEAIDRDKIEATLKDGVLGIVLPKAEAVKSKKIPIKAG
ncbi:MAG TPA: Hsp20/alpha crystallin family protein [Deltaproteobacteria bacterium]|nr:Hsp20/alpha crystallin family protein [Deltaproteobacteria bacterium]HOM27939.1 Hsp20/alpha crystallin family protein [Deltaproteobacteria bacterium]HPP80941.1 Hsp20/alpha crystallin family protein [Deltaproteobacteria bacterium]